jgi:hypothetical protein
VVWWPAINAIGNAGRKRPDGDGELGAVEAGMAEANMIADPAHPVGEMG